MARDRALKKAQQQIEEPTSESEDIEDVSEEETASGDDNGDSSSSGDGHGSGTDSDDNNSSDEEEEDAPEQPSKPLNKKASAKQPTAAAAAAQTGDLPELLQVLSDATRALDDVKARVAALRAEIAAGGLPTAGGLSYLEAKHLLLLEYCAALVAYSMLRAEGAKVEGHPVIARLVELRAFIERARPIDRQLAYQLDKLLRGADAGAAGASGGAAAARGGGDGVEDGGLEDEGGRLGRRTAAPVDNDDDDDALRYRPNPSALVVKAPLGGGELGLGGGDADGGAVDAGGVYVPPRLNPVAMDADRAAARQERRRQVEAQRRAKRSSLVRELAQELAGAPEEVEALLPGLDTAAARATRTRLDARAEQEEELMARVPLGKGEAKRLRAQRRAGLSGQGLLDDFEEEVADLVGSGGGGGGGGKGGGGGGRPRGGSGGKGGGGGGKKRRGVR